MIGEADKADSHSDRVHKDIFTSFFLIGEAFEVKTRGLDEIDCGTLFTSLVRCVANDSIPTSVLNFNGRKVPCFNYLEEIGISAVLSLEQIDFCQNILADLSQKHLLLSNIIRHTIAQSECKSLSGKMCDFQKTRATI